MKSNRHALLASGERSRLAPFADVVHLAALGGLGAFVLLGVLACGESGRNPRANVGGPARVSNNGTEARESDHPAVVLIDVGGAICTGSLVSPAGHVLTAGHCLMDEAMRNVVSAFKVKVRVNGRSFTASSLEVHEDFKVLNDSRHDLGVIVIPLGASGPAPLAFAAATPKMGEKVTMIGYGVPTPDDDVDKDGVRNDLDHCPMTPSFLIGSVEKSGERAGCEKGESSSTLPGSGMARSPDAAGILRKGTNVVSSLDFSGGIRVLGPFTTVARDGQVTPAFGDSGGPLLDSAGRIVGTVQGGSPALSNGNGVANDAFFVDVNAEKNKAFIAKAGVAL